MWGRRRRAGRGPRFERVGRLPSPSGFDELVTVSTGPAGPVALWGDADARAVLEAREESPGGARFPSTRTSSRPRVALAAYDDRGRLEGVVVTKEMPVAHPHVQPLPDGEFLVVGARCSWRPEGPERNALVVGADGSVVRTGTLGDGIGHLLVDGEGAIWAGYFDEGIFGNFGWGGPGPGPEPLGAAGIVRWTSDLTKAWEYPAVDGLPVDDCYTLNVGADGIWSCYYSDFPVVEIVADRVTVRRAAGGVSGPHSLLVAGDRVALIGEYGSRAAFRWGAMDGTAEYDVAEIVLDGGRPVPGGTLVCRGSVADLFVGADWYRFDLAAT